MSATQPFFCFDLDGTVLRGEILPVLAAEVGLAEEVGLLTSLTMQGKMPFEASFRLRCRLLREIPLERARFLASGISVDPQIAAFIQQRPAQCAIVTSNLDVWTAHLGEELGCEMFMSQGLVMNGELVDVETILDKSRAVHDLRERGHQMLVAIGDGANDATMFRTADFGIAFAGNHPLAEDLLAVSDDVASDSSELVQLLAAISENANMMLGALDESAGSRA